MLPPPETNFNRLSTFVQPTFNHLQVISLLEIVILAEQGDETGLRRRDATMPGIAILTVAIWVACIGWMALDVRRRVTSLVFWPFPTLELPAGRLGRLWCSS